MKKKLVHLQLLTLGVFLLASTNLFAAKKECYSDAEFKDFKTLYIKLQNQLNYEGQDAYLDKNMQVQLMPHAKNTPYPGKEFEAALFGEYQNSLRKIGKLYQDAKYDGDENFKSNEILVNFMKAIDDKSSDSEEYIKNTKIKDVINALETASKKRYANSSDKKFVITNGDKYLLEKLLTHAQDRLCSVNKYVKTNKGTDLFDANYLQKVKNAPLNLLVNTIKSAPIEKDSKIDLNPSSSLTGDLVDTDITIKSAITDNINQLSAWVKKVKSRDPACLAAIKTKTFANKIQGQVQGCNFGHFMETIGEENVNNLESVLHFINANERLLDRAVAKAETNLDELKLEGFISNAFKKLGTEIKCTIIDSANDGDKKVFLRNLPYDEKLNKYDTSGFVCQTSSKLLEADVCKEQFDLISDELGRGIELRPKKNIDSSLVFSIKEAKSCSNIPIKNLKSILDTNDGSKSNEDKNNEDKSKIDTITLKNDFAGSKDKDDLDDKTLLIDDHKDSNDDQTKCEEQKKDGVVFTWDADNKTCKEVVLKSEENKDDKKDDKKKTDDEDSGRIACEEKNAKWVEEVNNGTPTEKYRWDGKACKDVKPAKEAASKVTLEEVVEQEEAPSPPKRAPARFVPINIPSRQIYLLPGMP